MLHERHRIRNKGVDEIFASSDVSVVLPKYVMPKSEQDPRHAYQMVADELMLDGNSRQNLATFCQTWLEPEVHALMNLTCGAMAPDNGKGTYPVLAEVWHFDPEANRPGLSPDVGALVEKITSDTVGIHLVNVSQAEPRTVVVQTGAYGENRCLQVTCNRRTVDVNSHYFAVRLEAGCGGYLELKVDRFANRPRARLPWQD